MNNEHKNRGENVRKDMLQAIIEYIEQYGYPPSVREIGIMTGIKSTSDVHTHLKKLNEEGKIEIEPGVPRAIRIPGYKFVKVAE